MEGICSSVEEHDPGTEAPAEALDDDFTFDFQPFDLGPDRPLRFALPPDAGESPLRLFQAYFSQQTLQAWAEWTNAPREGPTLPNARWNAWYDTSVEELYIYIATLIYMGVHRENDVADYWNTAPAEPQHTPSLYISRNRFELLSQRLTIWDMDEERASPRARLFERVWLLSEQFIALSIAFLLSIPLDLTIDEAMVRFTGNHAAATLIRTKPIPRGFKIWCLCVCGYYICWLFHRSCAGPEGIPFPTKDRPKGTRQQKQQAESQPTVKDQALYALNNTQQVVTTLLARLPSQPYHLFMDNLFNTPKLLVFLRQHMQTGVTGTTRPGAGVYKPFAQQRSADNKSDKLPWNALRAVSTPDGLVRQLLWKDNAAVIFLSTVYSGAEPYVKRVHRRPKTRQAGPAWGEEHEKEVALPLFADKYNLLKGAVDTGDQLRSSMVWQHRALFLEFLLEVACVNTYKIQLNAQGPLRWRRAEKQSTWRRMVYAELFAAYGLNTQQRKHHYGGPADIVTCREVAVDNHQRTHLQRRGHCRVCMGFTMASPIKKRALGEASSNSSSKVPRVRTGCKECDVPLCSTEKCWYVWHYGK